MFANTFTGLFLVRLYAVNIIVFYITNHQMAILFFEQLTIDDCKQWPSASQNYGINELANQD